MTTTTTGPPTTPTLRPGPSRSHADARRDGDRAGAPARRPAGGTAAARAPRGRRAARRPRRDGRPARGLRDPAPDDPRRAAARGRRRLDRRGQVDAGQLPGRHPRHQARGAAPDDPVAGARPPPRRRGVVRPGPPAARARAGRPPDQRPRRAAARAVDGDAAGPRRSSTPPTSTRSRSRTARSPPSCSPPPTCGSSSPRPRATPTRCRGTSCARPPTARPRSRSSSTAPRPRRWTPSPRHLARMLASRGLKDSPLFVVDGGRGRRARGCCPSSSVMEIRGGSRALAEDEEARPSVVQQTLDGAIRTWLGVPTRWPTPPPSRSTPYAACARTPTRPTTEP